MLPPLRHAFDTLLLKRYADAFIFDAAAMPLILAVAEGCLRAARYDAIMMMPP